MFGIVLRNLREANNLTQEDLAKVIGLTPSSIGNYEQGSRTPRNDTIQKIANYFNVSIDYLMGNTNNTFKNELSVSSTQLSTDEQEFLDKFFKLTPEERQCAIKIMKKMFN